MNRHHPTATLFPYTTLFRSGYKLVGNARYPNAIEDYRRQFAFLRSLKPRLFLASHGNFFDLERKRKTKSFADPEGYRAFVEEQEARFEKVVAEQSGVVFHNATVIDGTGAPPRTNVDVVVRDGKIVEVVPARRRPAPADVAASRASAPLSIDATGKYII